MSRSPQARQRIRDVADELVARGVEPTPKEVRAIIGKGSPNTIGSELRRWREAREAAQTESAQVPSQAPGAPVEPSLVTEVARLGTTLSGLAAQLEGGLAGLADAAREWRQLAQEHGSDRGWMKEELLKLNERFEGVQRRMLLSVEEARDEARRWKESAAGAREELTTWRATMQQRQDALIAENGRLKGLLEAKANPPRAPG